MTSRKPSTSIISMVLAVLMCFYLIPAGALETLGELLTADNSNNVYPSSNFDSVSNDVNIDVVGEIESLRDANTKHFRMSDGSNIAMMYDQNVHYKDNDGKWQDIDNTLILEPASKEDGITGYIANQGNTKIKFSNSGIDSKLLNLTNGDYRISFGFEQSFNQKAKLQNSTAIIDNPLSQIEKSSSDITNNKTKLEKISELKKIKSRIVYADVMPETDLEYILTGTDIKENIIVKKAGESYVYSFLLNVGNLVAELQDDGSISLSDIKTKEIKYTIPAPYMFDAADDFSTDVSYTLEEISSGSYRLVVTASNEWINKSERAFPVTIDPIIKIGGYTTDILDTYVKEGEPLKACYDDKVLYCGYDSATTIKRMRIYWKTNQLPLLPQSSVVIDAQFSLGQLINNGYSGTDGINIGVREVLGTWNKTDLTWSNQPTLGSLIYDYHTTGVSKNGNNFYFNITTLAQKWYTSSSSNNGVVIYPVVEYNGTGSVLANARFKSTRETSYPEVFAPMFYVMYRDNKGLESRWTYTEHSLGDINGYVNDYTGNLVLVNEDISTKGSVLPISVGHVYNTYLANKQFTKNLTNISAPLTSDYSNMKIGYGWKLSVQETIVSKTIGDILYYVYSDSDGTELYFLQNLNGEFVSEDGYALKISYSTLNRVYTMTDDFGNTKLFDSLGRLVQISDVLGNQKLITYNASGQITKITSKTLDDVSGSSNTISTDEIGFEYNTSGALTRIKNLRDTSEYVDYLYSQTYSGSWDSASCNYLRQITYSKGNYYYIYYNSTGTISNIFSGDDMNKIYYDYITSYNAISEKTYRVSQVLHRDSSINAGQAVQFSYSDKETVIRTSGKDDSIGNSDDILNTYVFDNAGRTINVYSTDINKNTIYGASAATYNNGDVNNNDVRRNNTVSSDVVSGIPAINMLTDGNAESSTYWTSYVSSPGQSAYLSSTKKYVGSYSFRLDASSSGNSRYTQSISLTAGKSYTMSAYVNATSVSGYGAYISLGGVESEKITGTTNTSIQNGWQRISVTFSPTTTTSYTAGIHLLNSTGTVYFDCIQLEEGKAPSSYNLVSNGKFEGTSHEWTTANGGSFNINNSKSGYGSMKIDSSVSLHRYSYQTIPLNVPVNTTFVLSGWAKADSADLTRITGDPVRTFRLLANLTYNTGVVKEVEISFNPDAHVWQFASGPVVAKDYGSATTITSITVFLSYDFNLNAAYFDNVSLTMEPVQTYTYDSEGKLTSTKDALGNSDGLQYAANKVDLEKYTTLNGAVYNYTYRNIGSVNTHQVQSVYRYENPSNTSSNKITTNYTYNNQGGVIGTSTSSTGLSGKSITTSSTYSNYGNFLASLTDERGKTTTYDYNSASGLLNHVQDPNLNRVYYNYDTRQRLQNVFLDVDKDGILDTTETGVQYSYISNRLSGITTGSTAYTFSYNSYGTSTGVSITGRGSLASYTYNNYNGKLNRTTLGNGFYSENVYDELDRVVAIKYNGVVKFEFTYNGQSQLYSKKDFINNTTTYYEYDSLGRLIRGREMQGITGTLTHKLSVENLYDNYGRPKSSVYNIQGFKQTNSVDYIDKSNLISRSYFGMQNTYNPFISYGYDKLERLINEIYVEDDYNIINKAYTYYDGVESTKTTNLIRTETFNGSSRQYLYEYDNIGNISRVLYNIQHNVKYSYDNLNQLVREDNTYANRTYTYEYDKTGNILYKRTYAYTTGSLGSVLSTDNYGYNNAAWGDLLTSYNGKTINYDSIGNPTNWRGYMDTLYWEGRQLSRIDVGSYYNSYYYNENSIRTRKSIWEDVSGETTDINYIIDGSKILKETRTYTYNSPDTFYYYYNASGSITGFSLNGASYFYGKNIQGDIKYIYTVGGTLLAEYCYDAWGNLISILDVNGNTLTSGTAYYIATNNPFRYRGYYYDSETGLYYVSSRYYDPETCRWINADDTDILFEDQDSLIENNLFAYCLNNPVNMTDDTGYIAWWIGAAVGGALFDTAAYLIGHAITGQKITWSGVGKAALAGAISGVAFGAIGKGVKAITTAVKATKTAQKFASAGIKIMNGKYANKFFSLTGNLAKKYGSGIKFNKYGFPDFSKFSKYTTKIKGLTGNYAKDSALANARFGLRSTPKGFTWHHVEDGLTMMLVPTELHQAVRHTGGAALIKSLF